MSVDRPLKITHTKEESHPIVSFTSDTEFNRKKEEPLSRDINRQQFINLITDERKKTGTSVINASGDTDAEIAKATV